MAGCLRALRWYVRLGCRARQAVTSWRTVSASWEDRGVLVPRLATICLGFPEVTQRPSHGAPTWFVRGKASFVTLWEHGHHDHDFPHLWCAAPAGSQEHYIAADPDRFFRPPYVGGRGWLGVRLDYASDVDALDWDELADLCEDAYRTVAPKALIQQLESEG